MKREAAAGWDLPAADWGRHVSLFRQFLNLLGCAIVAPAYYLIVMRTKYPITMDIVVTLLLAELTRFFNERRRIAFYYGQGRPRHKDDCEKIDAEMLPIAPSLDCMAAVVGWREDPALFRRALESYKSARSCVFLLVGIDGDDSEDQDMVKVFNKAYPKRSRVIHVPEPLGEVAGRVREKVMAIQKANGETVNEEECDKMALQYTIELARTILSQQNISIGDMFGPNAVRHLCLTQRHMHKKGIMFTTLVFSLVIADMLGVEFLWSSDSDTLVFPDTLERTIDTIAADKTAGGASCGLVLHNETESTVTKLASTVYWGELYLTRSTPACTATSDCQSGPSTVFRLAALPSVLVPWYLQRVFGKRMIVNEDRHLTTNLLLRGWGVVFASDVLASTDTPVMFSRWLKQQIRWARAAHIESLLQPRVYAISNPLLFYGMTRREFGPIIGATAVVCYLISGRQLVSLSFADLAIRFGLSCGYNLMRNPDRLRKTGWWILPGMLFYHIPLPAVQLWSMLTLTSDGWGTTMRASGETAKTRSESGKRAWFDLGFFVMWMSIVAGAAARFVAEKYALDSEMEVILVVASMVIVSFGAWKVTIGAL